MTRMQVMTQLVSVDGDRAGLASWCRSTLAPQLASHPRVDALIVNLAQDNPLPALYPGESLQGDDMDVIVQTWVPSIAAWHEAFEPVARALSKRCAKRLDYRVSDTALKDDPEGLLSGIPTPGYKLMRGLFFHGDLGPAAAQRLWTHHASLAVRVHVGVARYTQHWVDEVLSPGAPPVGGFSELHFPSLLAMRDQYFDSPRGREEILHDIGHFIVAGTKRFYGLEYRIK